MIYDVLSTLKFTDYPEKGAVVLDNRDALIAHINHLDGVIRQRNEKIKTLQDALKAIQENPPSLDEIATQEIEKAYRAGWRECKRETVKSLREFMGGYNMAVEPWAVEHES